MNCEVIIIKTMLQNERIILRDKTRYKEWY